MKNQRKLPKGELRASLLAFSIVTGILALAHYGFNLSDGWLWIIYGIIGATAAAALSRRQKT